MPPEGRPADSISSGSAARSAGAKLVRLLAEAGALLNLAILPKVELQSLARYTDAAVQAMMPNRYYEEIYARNSPASHCSRSRLRALRKGGIPALAAELAGVLGVRCRSASRPCWAGQAREFGRSGARVKRAGAYCAGSVVGPGDA